MTGKKKYDVVVLGSGAGGSVMAYRLARAGLKVLVLEKGKREDTETFVHNEVDMLPRLYKYGSMQATTDSDMVILQGQTVGGSTVINNAIWLRANLDRVLADWAKNGAHVDKARLEHAYADLERALHVEPIPPALMNKGTDVFRRGCAKLGLPVTPLQHNRSGCLACGYCNYGCRYDRKTSMLVTFIPWAEGRGARVLDQVQHARIEHKGDRVTAVEYRRFGRAYRAEADAVVVACGAIGSSVVMLGSEVKSTMPIGKGFHMLGGVLVVADTEEPVDAFDGIGLTYMLNDTSEYIVETFFSPPASFAASMNGFTATHAQRMFRYRHLSQAGVMVGLEPTGSIKVARNGDVKLEYRMSKVSLERLKKGTKELSRIYLNGGAKAVYPGLFADSTLRSEAELASIDSEVNGADDILFGSAHPQGGNAMSDDPKRGVVGNDFRVHGYENLYVADASVFPTNLWANCQATVMAMSYVAADFVMGRRPNAAQSLVSSEQPPPA